MVVMRASDEATCMTGAELTIDSGLLAGSATTPARKVAGCQGAIGQIVLLFRPFLLTCAPARCAMGR